MSFNEAFADVIGLEGGYVNDPDDAGGETKYGISKRAYPDVNIAGLTLEAAKQIYLNDYWDKLQLTSVATDAIATELFEQAVNLGTAQATLHLQQALLMLGQPVYVDGVLGPQTLAAANRTNPVLLLRVLNGLQFMRYWSIARDNPSQKKFFKGWLKRVA